MHINQKVSNLIGNYLGINFKIISRVMWNYAMNVEAEHGSNNKLTDVTHDDPLKIGKIALAHLMEYPDYYHRLKKMEKKARMQWKNKKIKLFKK